MKKKIKYSLICLSILSFSGCSQLNNSINIDEVEYSKPTIKYDDFELALIKQSNKAERHWQEYTSLLTQRQELENSKLKWPMTPDEALKINKEELKWLLMGYEVRTKSKFKPIEVRNSF